MDGNRAFVSILEVVLKFYDHIPAEESAWCTKAEHSGRQLEISYWVKAARGRVYGRRLSFSHSLRSRLKDENTALHKNL